MPSIWTYWNREENHHPVCLYILFLFFFYPWTALLCYDCISYEGSVSDTGSGPHGRKDSTTKSRTGTFRDGVGEGVFCLSFFVVSIIDFDLDLLERDGVHLQIKDSSYWHALVTCCSQRLDVCRLSGIDSHKSCGSKVFTVYWKKKISCFFLFHTQSQLFFLIVLSPEETKHSRNVAQLWKDTAWSEQEILC